MPPSPSSARDRPRGMDSRKAALDRTLKIGNGGPGDGQKARRPRTKARPYGLFTRANGRGRCSASNMDALEKSDSLLRICGCARTESGYRSPPSVVLVGRSGDWRSGMALEG